MLLAYIISMKTQYTKAQFTMSKAIIIVVSLYTLTIAKSIIYKCLLYIIDLL
jgi:hypothetical protein